ncbi:hypothetical protein H0H92_008196 [Tricholoma furcatifolium]|nr:hypothetical protein H0H92_008196 [Tricholoma furcatifolium]
MLQPLPTETICHILHFLRDDRRTLASCSLVSTVFLASARQYLFQEVVLDCSAIWTFLKLLDVPWCTISPAVSRITIRGETRRGRKNLQRQPAVYVSSDDERLVARLQTIRHIKFQDIALEDIPVPFWRLLHDLRGVRELDVHHMSFESPILFFRYVCTLPALEALSISRSSIQVTAADLAPLRPKAPFYIPFLDVGRLSSGLLDWFLWQDPVPSVHTLKINLGAESAQNTTLKRFIQIVGPTVQNLQDPDVKHPLADDQISHPVHFSSFQNVRFIYVEGYLRLGEQPESRQFETLARSIFIQITSPLVEKVSLNFSLHIDETMMFFGIPTDILLDLFRWGALPETLGQECRENLSSLCLAIRGLPPYTRCTAEESLRKGPFASFSGRDILSVGFL